MGQDYALAVLYAQPLGYDNENHEVLRLIYLGSAYGQVSHLI